MANKDLREQRIWCNLKEKRDRGDRSVSRGCILKEARVEADYQEVDFTKKQTDDLYDNYGVWFCDMRSC